MWMGIWRICSLSEWCYKIRTLWLMSCSYSLKKNLPVFYRAWIQSDQITGLSHNFFLVVYLRKIPFFLYIWFGFEVFKSTRKHEMQELIQACHCGVANCILSGSDSALQKIYVLYLEICIIYRPPKTWTLKNLWSDVSSVVIYEIITASNIYGIPYCSFLFSK